MNRKSDIIPPDYQAWLADLKLRIHAAQQRATMAVNHELVTLYWEIGKDILDRQAAQGWGAKVIDRLSHDLRTAFPEMKGFSPRNLKYMRAFAGAWPDGQMMGQQATDQIATGQIVQVGLAQLPWYHHIALLDKLKTPQKRLWYADAQVKHPDDQPTIGILLCKSKNSVVAEYALRNSNKPIGVAEYQLVQSLPDRLQTDLPTIEEIEAELSGDFADEVEGES